MTKSTKITKSTKSTKGNKKGGGSKYVIKGRREETPAEIKQRIAEERRYDAAEKAMEKSIVDAINKLKYGRAITAVVEEGKNWTEYVTVHYPTIELLAAYEVLCPYTKPRSEAYIFSVHRIHNRTRKVEPLSSSLYSKKEAIDNAFFEFSIALDSPRPATFTAVS